MNRPTENRGLKKKGTKICICFSPPPCSLCLGGQFLFSVASSPLRVLPRRRFSAHRAEFAGRKWRAHFASSRYVLLKTKYRAIPIRLIKCWVKTVAVSRKRQNELFL